jgi:hypothetical protein
LIDLTGSDLGKVIGRGRSGHRRHGPGTITPWPAAFTARNNKNAVERSNKLDLTGLILTSKENSREWMEEPCWRKNGRYLEFLRERIKVSCISWILFSEVRAAAGS